MTACVSCSAFIRANRLRWRVVFRRSRRNIGKEGAGAVENAINRGDNYDITYCVEGFHDQRLRWLRAVGNLKVDASGEFSAFTGVLMDITEQRQDEQRKKDFI